MIQVSGLSKHFKRKINVEGSGGFSAVMRNIFAPRYEVVRAVDDITFNISSGEIVGYIGPNGAGKSTSIKMLVGILTPTGGTVHVNGLSPVKDRKANARQIGVVFGQKTQLWWDLPLRDSFMLLKDMYKVSNESYNRNMKSFDDILELDSFLDTPVRQLSLGQRMRADVAAALLHDPKLIFLDEPTIGIDIVAKERLRAFIQEINSQRQTTVLLTTHDIGDIEKLCKRIMIINRGHVIYDGALEELKQRFDAPRKLVVEFGREVPDFDLPGIKEAVSSGTKKSFTFTRDMSPSALIAAINERYEINDLTIEEPEIEAVIRDIYRQQSHSGGMDD
jgi:ABC-2 type transport system ATP-binding protein